MTNKNPSSNVTLLAEAMAMRKGDAEDAYPIIISWKVTVSDKSVWETTIQGSDKPIMTDTKSLFIYKMFAIECATQTRLFFRNMKQDEWTNMLRDAKPRLEVELADADTTRADVWLERFTEFLSNQMRAQFKKDILRGVPWEDEENTEEAKEARYYFRMQDLEGFLLKNGFKANGVESLRTECGRRIRGLGGDGGKHVRLEGVGRVWFVSSAAIVKAVKLELP